MGPDEAGSVATLVGLPSLRYSEFLLAPRTRLYASMGAGALLLVAGGLQWVELSRVSLIVSYVSLGIGMCYGLVAAYEALRLRAFDIDVLMVVAAALAALIGHPAEGALLLTLFVLAGSLEDLATARTDREISALAQLLPAGALVLRARGPAGVPEFIEAEAVTLKPGETIRVRPGEMAPVDCKITVGESSFDQSAITGEATPRVVGPGDELFAGTVNTDDPVDAVVLRAVSESSLQKILNLVLLARERREPVQRVIDRFSQPYSLCVMVGSIVVFLVWWLVLGAPAFGLGAGVVEGGVDGRESALYTAITFLIVTSPCALIIAVPTATLCAIARAAKSGVLIKGGDALSRLAATSALCSDKTGTLTFGRPRLYEVHPVGGSEGSQLLGLAAALEADSTHPIATAIRGAAVERKIAALSPGVTRVNHQTARGIEGEWNGRLVRLGSYDFVEELIPTCYRARTREVLGRIQRRGHIAVVIGAAEHATQPDAHPAQCGVLIMSDALRPGAHNLVKRLHALNIRPVVMLTGDNALTAERVAQGLGLDGYFAHLLPQDKLDHLRRIKASHPEFPRRGHHVALIGDGINDAPALAGADVSLAMGTIGTAAALENADIVLLSDSLAPIPWAIGLARRARRTVLINIILATAVIVIMAAVTLIASRTGHPLPLWIGVLAHEGGTLLVVLHSLTLLRT